MSLQPSNYAQLAKQAFGIDSGGTMFLAMRAPADATVISPITDLLVGTNSESKLETQLGINGSVFSLVADRDMKTFVATDALISTDPVIAADGERILAHHIRILAVAAAMEHMHGRGQNPTGVPFYRQDELRTYLDGAGARFIFTNVEMSALLRSVNLAGVFPLPVYSDKVISAAAHLVDAYCATIGIRIANRQQATRFMLGIRGYLIPELTRLLAANNDATADQVLAITNPQIVDATARYTEQLPFNVNANLFPMPDFYTIAQGGTYLVPSFDVGSNGNGPFKDNDLHLNPNPTDANHFFPGTSQVTAVSIPVINAAQVSAVLNADKTVTIRALPGFTGITYFDYTVTHSRGDVEQGRVYVRVR